MQRLIVLLRAVNVGGTGKLLMTDLKAMCEELGFQNVRTYIASGNIVLDSPCGAIDAKSKIEARLQRHAIKAAGVIIRTPEQMAQILTSNPFPFANGSRNIVIFLDQFPQDDTLLTVTGQKDEEIALGKQEIYVHYGAGMGTSKLKIPAAKTGTARNMNTVAKLVEMSSPLAHH